MLMRYTQRFKWCETWSGENRHDFIGLDDEEVIGRIQLDQTTPNKVGLWRWNVAAAPWVPRTVTPPRGWAETRGKALRLVEKHYESLNRRSVDR